MILVTLGTQDKPFERLIRAVEKQIEIGNIKDEVIVQSGCTKYKSNKMKIIRYISIKDFNNLLKEADFVISHAGVGSIIQGLQNNKKMIVAARKKEYGEHVNNHQEQILENFGDEGYITPVYDLDKLDEALEKVKNFTPKKFEGNNEKFINNMILEIEKLLN